VKPLTIVFTWFKPKPFVFKPGVLNVKRCKRVNEYRSGHSVNEIKNCNEIKYNVCKYVDYKRDCKTYVCRNPDSGVFGIFGNNTEGKCSEFGQGAIGTRKEYKKN